MRHGTNWILFPVSCCLFVLLSGCVESKNPLSDPNADETDQSLVGIWTLTTQDGKKTVLTISMPSSDENLPKGLMKCEGQDADGKNGKNSIAFIPTKIGDNRFLSLFFGNAGKGWKPVGIKGYSLVKYKVSGSKCRVYYGNAYKRIYDAIKNGDLRGTTRDQAKTGVITEPTESLRKYVEDNEAWLFTEKCEYTKE